MISGEYMKFNDKEVKLALNNYLIINNDEQKYNYSSNGYNIMTQKIKH